MTIEWVNPLEKWEFLGFWKGYEKQVTRVAEATATFNEHGYKYVLPRKEDWFKALELTPYEEVKCVILGQDPYPTPGHAMGLAFSVLPHVRPIPASLRNMFREYSSDLGYPLPNTGDLTDWAKEGVLLWNTVLTVEANKPNSHAGIGWEKLTYEIIRALGDRPVVFILMGRQAQEYGGALDPAKVLRVAHPSPLSARKGFFGSRPYTRANAVLERLGVTPINWRLR